MKCFFNYLLIALFGLTLFISCDNDDKKPEVNLTPQENNKKLEDVGMTVLGKINPQDHKELIQTLQIFGELIHTGELELEKNNVAKSFAQNVFRIVSKNDLGKLVAYNSYEADIYQAKEYYGVYTYNERTYEWDYQNSSSMLQFNFPANSQTAVITITAAEKEVEVEIDDETILMVPVSAEATVKRGSNELCKVTMSNTVKTDNNSVDLTANLSASGYVFNAVTKMTETLATAEFSMKKGSETLVSGNCKVTGTSMTDIDVIEDTEDIEDLFKTAEAYVQIIDEVNVKASCSNIKQLVKELDNLDYDSDEKVYTEKQANIINKYTEAGMYYNGSNEVIANIEMQAYMEDSWSWNGNTYEYWEVEPVLVFRVDNSRYSFEDYFGKNGFGDLIKSYENLAKQYESFLK